MIRTTAAAIAALSLFIASGASAQPMGADRGPIISVRGDGRAEVPPEIARLSAQVTTKGRTLQAAASAHKTRATQADAALKAMAKDGVVIEQSTFRLDQVHQPPTPQGTPRQGAEYQAVTSFQIKITKLADIDAIVTAIASTGLVEVQNLRFALDDKSNALTIARRNAVANARQRAQTYAEAAGVRLGEVIEITDNEPRMFREVAAAAPMAARSMKVAPPENITVTAGISMTWRIAQP
jgi:uncharacterized protein YggE